AMNRDWIAKKPDQRIKGIADLSPPVGGRIGDPSKRAKSLLDKPNVGGQRQNDRQKHHRKGCLAGPPELSRCEEEQGRGRQEACGPGNHNEGGCNRGRDQILFLKKIERRERHREKKRFRINGAEEKRCWKEQVQHARLGSGLVIEQGRCQFEEKIKK